MKLQPATIGPPITTTKIQDPTKSESTEKTPAQPEPSMLSNWPVQLRLLPLQAPYLNGARLLLSADCVPFAVPDFHRRFLKGRIAVMACPKLDSDIQQYVEKLTAMFSMHNIPEVVVPFMEVPCCTGLVRIVEAALSAAQSNTILRLIKVGISGEILDTQDLKFGDEGKISA